MLTQLFTYLKFEQQLLEQLISYAEQQQKALVQIDIETVLKTAEMQEEALKSLRNAENQRIKMMMNWLKVSRTSAMQIKMSDLEKHFHGEELVEISALKDYMMILTEKLKKINMDNRILSNRARRTFAEFLEVFREEKKHVCNVTV